VPADEPERGAVLERLDRDAALSNLAQEAVETFDAAVGGVGLADRYRYRPLAFDGADPEPAPRSSVPCAYTVCDGRGVTIVNGIPEDPRFAGRARTPAADCGLRWYAGAPVVVAGRAVGTVAVYDRESRTVEAAARDRLVGLAGDAAARLSTRPSPARARR